MMVRRLACVLLLCLVGACASKPARHAAAPPPVAAEDSTAACLSALDRRHADFDRSADFQTPEGCGIEGAVKLKGVGVPLNRPLLMACTTALSLADFEARVVVPAAAETLGRKVATITSAGSYDCRGQRSDHPERLSEHGKGKAIDISGFVLEDGTRITVLRNWSGKDEKAEFLHKVAAGACKMFAVVLTPKTNKLHRDHLHMDNGPYHKCDA